MPFLCFPCGATFRSNRGLSNHRRACVKYKEFDELARYKRRRLEIRSETPGPAQGNDLSLDAHDNDYAENPGGSPIRNSSPAAAPPQTTTRSGRSVRFPRRFDDYLPGMRTTALAHIPSKENRNPPQAVGGPITQPDPLEIPSLDTGAEDSGFQATGDDSPLERPESLTTDADCFGVYRMYARKPLHDPSDHSSLNTHSRNTRSRSDCQPGTSPNQGAPGTSIQNTPYYFPFSNPSAAAMMVAHHSGTPMQSIQKTTQIAHILGSLGSDLNPSDLITFNAALEHKKLDAYLASAPDGIFHREDGWLESSVRIRLPLDKRKMPESSAVEFEVEGLFHRDIIDVISSVYQSDTVRSFNHIPFKQFWKPSDDSPPERLYGEIFSCDVMLDADNDICKCCLENDSDPSDLDLEAVSVPLLFYSDSTHLANFGSASCWPVYLFFGSQSKYVWAMPTSSACHHIAYMPEVCHV